MRANTDRIWQFPPGDTDASLHALGEALQLPIALSRFLIKAGFGDLTVAKTFLQPRLQDLSDPFLLSGIREAVNRVLHAIHPQEPVVLFRDYHVDVVNSIANLFRIFGLYLRSPGPVILQ